MTAGRAAVSCPFVAGFVLLVANSAYLAAAASPTLFFYFNVALHVALGLVFALWTVVSWASNRHRLSTGASSAVGVLILCAGVGTWLTYTGATRAHEPALYAHAALAGAGVLLLAAWLDGYRARLSDQRERRLATAGVALLCVAVVAPIVVRAVAKREWQARYRIVNPLDPPTAMTGEGGGPASPFFPSSARTNVGGTIPSNFFMTSATCGRCHKDIYDQWSASVHHMSSFNNQWYRKAIEYMQDVVGTQPSKWCAGCHDHAVFFNGRFDRPMKEQIDTPEARAGLSCTSCHSIVHVGGSMGQGDFTVEYPPLHDLAVSDNPFLQRTHDALLYLAPEPHRNTFMKPFHREQTAEFCSVCHKVHLDVPVNNYRWFRGFNDYDNWQASGVSGQGARSFYYPAPPQQCADCHMPLVASNDPAATNGKVRSHRFPGANTALPFANHDTVQLKAVQDFLRDGQISVDVFGIARTAETSASGDAPTQRATEPRLASTFAVGEESAQFGAVPVSLAPSVEVFGPLDRVPVTVRRGESVRVEVVVRTRKVGHFFPGGTVDAFDVWVELEAVDERGQVLLHSGSVDDEGKGPVESGAHFYRSLQLDEHGNLINKRNAWATRSVAYVRLVPPGAADTVHYRLVIPDTAGDRIFLRAKVNYRKFTWWNTQWAYAGVRDPRQPKPDVTRSYDDGPWVFNGDTSKVSGATKAIPDIPITVMAQAQATLSVVAKNAPLPDVRPFLDRSVRERWNDYGIGLLLQGDLKGAEAVFLKVTAMDPAYADGPVNVARAQIQEGDVAASLPMLEKALAIDPHLAKTHFFLGTALKTLGRYDEALDHLRAAAASYPRDRVVLDQIGRIQFLQRRFGEAIATFQRALLVDPEDLQAHYNLMLCYQGLGNAALAAREQERYARFKADEAAQGITGPYRLKSPDDNNERQQIHEHRGARTR
ncbi:MAG: tetratricopeptide repeat protein [Acidobacteria bacterium]|nr:tetratricopeptide repeat protein [Acidobacteriota bacterium]